MWFWSLRYITSGLIPYSNIINELGLSADLRLNDIDNHKKEGDSHKGESSAYHTIDLSPQRFWVDDQSSEQKWT